MIKNFLKIDINPNRTYGLDILRASAILFVVFGHGKSFLPSPFQKFQSFFILDGVSLFFVLSGFLIGGILIKILEEKGANRSVLFTFWKRRWFRTLPNYFLILSIITLYYGFNPSDFAVSNKILYFVFSQNLSYPHPTFFPEAWSLSVEEWFYILLPCSLFFLISVFKTKPKQAVLFACISILTLVTAFRVYRHSTTEVSTLFEWAHLYRKQVITRLDSLIFGVLGAYTQYYYPKRWAKYNGLLLIISLTIFIVSQLLKVFDIIPVGSFYNCVFSFSIISLATLLLLPYLSCFKTGTGMLYKILTFISLISYSMYLIHLTIVKGIVLEAIPWDSISQNEGFLIVLKYSSYWAITIFISIIIYKYYEKPLTSLRDKKM